MWGFTPSDWSAGGTLHPLHNSNVSVPTAAVLCREEAQNLWAKKADFDKLGIRVSGGVLPAVHGLHLVAILR